jgi:YD repeat-containing protein
VLVNGALAHADITYIYDELGRLRAVIDPSQTDGTAIYSYDAVGNILSITRQSASQVSIIEFVPKSGPVGSTVTIQGTGFSATPSQNAVAFNGTAATVTAASANELTVTVPVGATTGAIGVTVSGVGSATSSEPFTVTAASLAPTITGFSPTLGAAGTAVDVTGTNFETLPAANAVRFAGNELRAAVTTATSTALTTKVPPGAVSGKIKLATPAGSTISTQDFFVPVGPYTVADVVTTVRMAIGETRVVSIPTATKVALVIFDGTPGQKVSFRFTGTQISSAVLSVYKPDGALFFSPINMGISGRGGVPLQPYLRRARVPAGPVREQPHVGRACRHRGRDAEANSLVDGPVARVDIRWAGPYHSGARQPGPDGQLYL